MKKLSKLIALLLTALMVLALVPMAALAEGAAYQANERKQLAKLDDAWKNIDAVEKDAASRKATPHEVTLAAYNAALNEPLVDKGSLVWESDIQFAFTVDGMHCLYYYTARAGVDANVRGEIAVDGFRASNAAGAPDVLLVGPYYGVQSTFTDQYKEEALSIAEATGGTRTMLSGSAATGPAIVSNYLDKGVVIYDSHGTQSGTSSYLCLTTNTGITTEDYNNGWAVSSGSAAYIDGRYVQNHVTGQLSNCMVWMAICEGMKKEGNGTTGTALLAAGAGCVYGYSQSVTFAGDYEMEEVFWNDMKDGATVADAFANMVSTTCPNGCDPSGDAYPIVMSDSDAFPSNPDSRQTVYCDWTLLGGDPVAIESFAFANAEGESISSVTVAMGKRASLKLVPTPSNANNFTVEWSVSDPSVATVEGRNKNATVTGVNIGTATLTATVTTESKAVLTDSITINVTEAPKWNPTEDIVTGEDYLIGFESDGVIYLAVNYNPTASNHYYNSISSDYYGYTAVAVMNGESVIGATGNVDDLDYCTWRFESIATGLIYSGYESNVYLQAYSGSSYPDLHPGTNNNFNWTYDYENATLFTYTTETRYAEYVNKNGMDLMGVTGTVPTNSRVVLFSLSAPEPDPSAPRYTVTFVDWDGTVLKTEEVREGYAAHAPADPVREGYRFTGWDVDFSNVTSDLTVTAQYEVYVEPVYEWVPTDTIVPGEEYLIGLVYDGTTYLMVNYAPDFSNHYYTSIDATYYGYTAPAQIVNGKVVGVSGNATDLVNCAWKFSSTSGGTIQSAYSDYYYLVTWSSASYNDLYPNNTNTSYFWTFNASQHTLYRTIDGVNRYAGYVSVENVDHMQVTSDIPASSVQLFVKQEAENPEQPTYYTVTFVDWDGTEISTQEVEQGNAATAPADPIREGYTFTGWDVAFNNVQSDLTVTAQYEINTYTVTFVDWDGTEISTQEVEHGSAATAPEAPSREGYTFTGWDVDFTNVTGDLTITAQYEQNAPSQYLKGDVNCDGLVDSADITLAAAYAMSAGSVTAQGVINGDMNGDGVLTAADLSALYSYIQG
ncbi:MAG: InlB B-repeat-containing protein [Clostridia bacterium]|nr:InlB B-repeat-containing protein [Clostridia bacterium]